jgi:hypothetical protein
VKKKIMLDGGKINTLKFVKIFCRTSSTVFVVSLTVSGNRDTPFVPGQLAINKSFEPFHPPGNEGIEILSEKSPRTQADKLSLSAPALPPLPLPLIHLLPLPHSPPKKTK